MTDESSYWTRRLSRRAALRGAGLGAAGLAGAALIGCGDDDDDDEEVAAQETAVAGTPAAGVVVPGGVTPDEIRAMSREELRETFHSKHLKNLPGWQQGPKYGGTLHTRVSRTVGVPGSWDPTGTAGGNMASFRQAHDQLLEWDVHELMDNPNFPSLRGELATGLPEQPDETAYIFKLNKGVKFHDIPPVNGAEFVAEDVKYSIDAYREATRQAPYFADLDSVDVVDDYTVRFNMARPAAYMLEIMGSNENWIFSKAQGEAGTLSETLIGTGPFIFEGGESGGGHNWRKNPEYWKIDHWTGMQLPYLDGIEARQFGDPEAHRAAFVAGQEDTGVSIQRPEQMAQLTADKPDVIFHIWQPWSAFQPHVGFRLDKEPWSDVRVRRALSLAIDRDAIIKAVFGGMAEYGYGLSYAWFGREFSWNKDELKPWITHDPAEAKKLITAAGYSDGFGRTGELLTSYSVGGYFDAYTFMIDNWKRTLGVDVQLKSTPDSAAYYQEFYGKTYQDMVGSGFGLGFMDTVPDSYVYVASHSKSTANYYFVDDPELDALAEKQRATPDRDERAQVINEWKDRDLDQVTRLFSVGQYFLSSRSSGLFGKVSNTVGGNPFGWGSHITRTYWKP